MKSIIESLGHCRFRSPLPHMDCHRAKFKLDSDQIVCDDRLNRENVHDAAEEPSLTFEVAGPREHLYFDSANTTAAIVTCGGLCPDVIRGIVMELWHGYRVKKILGIRYGYEGLVQRHGRQPFQLRPEVVSTIQTFGGVSCAHIEAICASNGIGLVKLMGRESGFIACYATLASQCVNFHSAW